MMPTLKDVAEKAGVGIATVSRAMNGTGFLSIVRILNNQY